MCKQSLSRLGHPRAGSSTPTVLGFFLVSLGCSPSPLNSKASMDALHDEGVAALSTGKSCKAIRLSTEPDLLGWDPGSRGKLVSIASQGLAVVRYHEQGCDVELTVLGGCFSRKARYEYRAYSENQQKTASNEFELYANFPVGIAELRGQLTQGRGVRADYHLAGVERIPVGISFQPRDLEGDCTGATHVVSAIYRGVFAIAAGQSSELRADLSLLGGQQKESLNLLDHAGEPERCDLSGALRPGCDVPLRLELSPIEHAEQVGSATVGSPDALPEAETVTNGRRCPEHMAPIPGGTFFMGGNENWHEQPVHQVTVSPYCIDLREVTVGDYQRCQESGVCSKIVVVPKMSYGEQCFEATTKNRDYPRNCVTWRQSRRYCAWLDKRLPTEAEWEFAARGGPKSFAYPWGNQAAREDAACWNRQKDGPCVVGSFRPGAYGLWDMAGNVDEWVWDWFGRYSGQAQLDPTGPTTGNRRVVKGGSYTSDIPLLVRGEWRADEDRPGANTGLRCARDR
jgi:formylglycine-generating enzyme required for sulfatase activity